MTVTFFDPGIAAHYKSRTQVIRVLSERWTHGHVSCPSCGNSPLTQSDNNQPVSDFWCVACGEVYELKSKRGMFGRKLTDGAYGTMMKRLADRDSPSLLLLSYGGDPLDVTRLVAIPSQFLVPSLIEKRRPLGPTARRAGWTGCNIFLDGIPKAGRITLFQDGKFRPGSHVRSEWQRTKFLLQPKQLESRGWLVDVMRGIEGLKMHKFALTDLYGLQEWFRLLHPGNKHIREKIRQQVQRLRDAGHVQALGGGSYCLTTHTDESQISVGLAS